MPSGFQLDNNQLNPGYYRVVINMGAIGEGSNATWTETDDGPYGGKITPYSWDACSPSSVSNLVEAGTDQYVADDLARGNLRFQAIVETLSSIGDCQILDIETYASEDIENQCNNGSLAFTVKYDRPAFIGPAYNMIQKQDNAQDNDYANGDDGNTSVDGATYKLYYSASGSGNYVSPEAPADSIKDLVWRALARDTWSRSTRVLNVATNEGIQQVIEVGNPTNSSGNSYDMINDISVNELDGTTNTIQAD